MSTLPDSWLTCKLGDVINYGATQKAEPTEIPDNAWVLELEDIEKDTSKVLQRLTFKHRQSKSTKSRFEMGDILYGKLRPYLNKVVRADQDGYCTTEIIPIKPSEIVEGAYLFHWLKTPTFIDYVTSVSHGLSMPRLGTEAGKQAPFILAPLNEQKRIADKLDAVLARVDACRDRLDRVPVILKRFRQSVLAAAVSGKLTADWRVSEKKVQKWELCSVGSLINLNPRTDAHNDVCVGFVPMLLMGTGYLEKPAFEEKLWGAVKKGYTHFQEGDVLLAKITPCFENGKAGIMTGLPNGIGAGSTEYFVCRVIDSNKLVPKFLLAFFKTESFMKQGELEMTCPVGHKRVPKQYIQNSEINVPSLSEQTEIVRRVESLFAYADRLEARHQVARAQVEKLTPATLAKAFRGELVPQDPNDEPASALLECIRNKHNIQSANKPKRGRQSPQTTKIA